MPSGIYKRSEEQKRKMSETHKKIGAPWLIGKKKVVSEQAKKNMSLGQKGKKQSEEWKKKRSLMFRGENNPFWKGGRTKLVEQIRKCFKYRQWRSDIFFRDGFICIWCGQKGGKLNADHIKPFSLILRENNIKSIEEADICEELWDINNGRTLCIYCHQKTESYKKKALKIR